MRILICGGMGSGLRHRLRQPGIEALVTSETDPDHAVAAYLTGNLPLGEAEQHAKHAHHHGHGHQHASPVFLACAQPGARK